MAGYSAKAQPFLDAIAAGVFASTGVRDWLIAGTPAEPDYAGATVLIEEQRAVRWRVTPTLLPFWATYYCRRERNCTCRIAGSVALESDAIFFFRNTWGRVLAVHVEFKHPTETFSFGQPEAYPLRAACFASGRHLRPTVNPHHDWATVLFCGRGALADPRLCHFQRVITHEEAAARLPGYPMPRHPA